MCQRKLPSTSGVSMYPGEFLQLPSTFRAARIHSVNFHVAGRSSVNFCQLFMRLGNLPSTFREIVRISINFHQLSFRPGSFCQLLSTFLADGRSSVNFPCSQETFHQLPSNFHTAGSSPPTSVNLPCCRDNFRQLSLRQCDLP